MLTPGSSGARVAEAFTIVELMIVVVIVGILSLVAVPVYSSHIKTSRMSEGVTGAGVVRTGLRVYAAGHGGKYPTLSDAPGDALSEISIGVTDLDGKYLKAQDYSVTSSATSYTIRATLPEDTSYWYEMDEDGNESKGWN